MSLGLPCRNYRVLLLTVRRAPENPREVAHALAARKMPRRVELISSPAHTETLDTGGTAMQGARLRLTGLTVMSGVAAMIAVVGCSSTSERADSMMSAGAAARVAATTLSGSQEVPPVSTQATGVSTITVTGDKLILGNVQTSGMTGTIAHIHQAPRGQNGPPVITLEKSAANVWSVPA